MRTLLAPTRPDMAASRFPLSSRQLIGAILTGGSSSRFGSDKAAVIGPLALDALRGAGLDPVLTVGGGGNELGVPNLEDRYPGEGPLGGLATCLTYASSGWVLLIPCDHPLLRSEHLEPLVEALNGEVSDDEAVVATVGGRAHPSIACWPASWARPAHQAMRSGERRFRRALELGAWHGIEIDPAALEDADDPETLKRLLVRREKP